MTTDRRKRVGNIGLLTFESASPRLRRMLLARGLAPPASTPAKHEGTIRRADRLLERAERDCRAALTVLCSPEVLRAVRRWHRADELAQRAVRVASSGALDRLGVSEFPKLPVGGTRDDVRLTLRLLNAVFRDTLELPSRAESLHVLVEEPRAAVAAMKRLARADAASPELKVIGRAIQRDQARAATGKRKHATA